MAKKRKEIKYYFNKIDNNFTAFSGFCFHSSIILMSLYIVYNSSSSLIVRLVFLSFIFIDHFYTAKQNYEKVFL